MKSLTRRLTLGAMLVALTVPFSSCAAKYEEMLRHRDETIRDLEARLSSTRSENQDLRKQNLAITSENGELRRRKAPQNVVTASTQDPLAALQDKLRNEGAPVTVRKYRRGISIGIPSSVSFAAGKTSLTSQGQSVLRTVGRLVRKQYPGKRIFVEGHTDSDPIRKTKKLYRNNRHLSAMRAEAVAAFLSKDVGLAEKRLVIVGYGPFEPVSPGNKAENRRVEIVISD